MMPGVTSCIAIYTIHVSLPTQEDLSGYLTSMVMEYGVVVADLGIDRGVWGLTWFQTVV